MEIYWVPTDSIKPDPNQPRKIFSESHIKGLAQSLLIEGIINPIEVDEDMMIITGECRWRASKEAKLEEVPININKNHLSPFERLRRQMAENVHQSAAGGSSPMNAIDVAKGYKRMIEMQTEKDYKPGLLSRDEVYGLIKVISKELGVTRKTMYEYLKLLEEPKYVIEDLVKGKARTLFREIQSSSEKYQEELKKGVVSGQITRREDLIRFNQLVIKSPEKAEIELFRLTHQQSVNANKILNRAVELELALVGADLSFTNEDKKMVVLELRATKDSIDKFLKEVEN